MLAAPPEVYGCVLNFRRSVIVEVQMMLDSPPRDDAGKGFYADKERVLAAADRIHALLRQRFD